MSGGTALLAVVLLVLFAPTSLGGPFSYAVVRGDSMSPGLTSDDVVLLRSAGDYAIGDVVAYRHPQIGNVLHRIVDYDGERYTLRGDNRGGSDSYQPTRSEVIGRQWAVIPGGGAVLREIQSPRNAVLLALAAIAIFVAGAAGVSGARNLRGKRVPLRAAAPILDSVSAAELRIYSSSGRTVLGVAIAVAVVCFALLAQWRAEGSTQPSTEQVQYEQRGTFSYGRVVEGGVYDFDTLAAPDPLFRLLLDDLPLRYAYEIVPFSPGAQVTNVIGSYDVIAEIRNQVGWRRTYTLVPSTPIAGDRFDVNTTIYLSDLDRQIAAVTEATGISQGTHSVRVMVRVRASGQLDGLPFESASQQSLQFSLTDLQLLFDAGNSQLEYAETGSVSRPITVPRTLSAPLLPLSLNYARIPTLGFGGLVLATLAGLAVGFATARTSQLGEAQRIRARFGRAIVALEDPEHAIGENPVAVERIDDLVRIADSEGVAIMHYAGADGDEYFVVARDVTWRYASWTPQPAPTPRVLPELINATEG